MATKSGVKSLKRDKGHILKFKTFYTKLRILALLLQQWEMNLMHDYDVIYIMKLSTKIIKFMTSGSRTLRL